MGCPFWKAPANPNNLLKRQAHPNNLDRFKKFKQLNPLWKQACQPKSSVLFAKIISDWTALHLHLQNISVYVCFSTMQAGSWVERRWGRRGISNVAKENAWKFHFGTNYGLQLKQICCTMGGRYLPLFSLEKVPWLKSPCGGRGKSKKIPHHPPPHGVLGFGI